MEVPRPPVAAQGPTVRAVEEEAAMKWLEENLRGDIEDLRWRLGRRVPHGGTPNSSGGGNHEHHPDPLRELRAAWDLRKEDVEQRLADKMKELLKPVVQKKIEKRIKDLSKGRMTVMHLVAFVGLPGLTEMLATREKFLQQINAQNSEGQTPLHLAALTGSVETVKVLLQSGPDTVRADLEDNSEQTAFEIADEVGWHEIVRLLLSRPDVRDYLGKRRADRSMYGDGTNAILVGAALIASITFAGWLQPPLGFQTYYDYPRNATMSDAPPDAYQQYVAITEHFWLKVFWVTNSLSFYFAIAAILAGAGAMVPRRGLGELAEVKRKRGAAYLTGFVFSWAVVFVVLAFTAAGLTSLPPIFKYESYMLSTLLVGVAVCIYGFSSARMTDPSIFLKYMKIVDPAWYFSELSSIVERCFRPFGYHSFESRTRQRRKRYNNYAPGTPPREEYSPGVGAIPNRYNSV